MYTQKIVVSLFLIELLGASMCWSQGPVLVPREFEQRELPTETSFWLSAPNIAVVKVLSNKPIGRLYRARSGQKPELQLFEISVEVENVLQGEDLGESTSFYFFRQRFTRGRYDFDPGERYIVFLRKDGEVLRTMTDLWYYFLPVGSGRHETDKLPSTPNLETKIAYILLTPGSGFNSKAFEQNVDAAVRWRGQEKYKVSLLSQLLTNPDRSLRDQVCVILAVDFWIMPDCLASASESSDERLKERAKGLMQKDDAEVERRLRESPLTLLPDIAEKVSDGFEIFTFDSRPEVRRLA